MINKIIIVGGGSSGWMTAAAIKHKFPEINLTLIESKKIPTIGVGESTLGFINEYFSLLDLHDDEWMSECDATYKNSIQFTNFHKPNTKFQYPFGNLQTPRLNSDKINIRFVQEYMKLKRVNSYVTNQDFVRYFNINGLLAEFNKQTKEPLEGYNFRKDTAYHFDAELLGQYLKKKFCKKINYIEGTVDEIITSSKGIESIRVHDKQYSSDLFIDCTGFKSLLMTEVEDDFIPFEYLMNDRAVVARMPYKNVEEQKKFVRNVTDCKVMDSGWIWDIPLWNRKSKGYVYSTKFIDDEQAEIEFRTETGHEDDVFYVDFRHGIRKNAWVKNVLTVGLSYGFIEPLESTGLFSTHENILRLIQVLENSEKEVNLIEKDMFNIHLRLFLLDLSEFVSVHYGLSRNRHTEYWRHVTENVSIDQVKDKYYFNTLKFLQMGFRQNLFEEPLTDGGMIYILAGMDHNFVPSTRLKFANDNILDLSHQKELYTNFRSTIDHRINLISSFQSSYEFLKQHVYYKD
tara:strand:+ start:985 stop:2529 length:1545 start_codon:yes stop_codon:yes gene_type:complete